jgi:hypothetical protein
MTTLFGATKEEDISSDSVAGTIKNIEKLYND